MFYRSLPVGIGVNVCKVVVVFAAVLFQNASGNDRLAVDSVHTGHIESHRVEGSEHADVRDNRDIVLRVAVTVWRYVCDKADMEAGTVFDDCIRIFCDLAV